MVATYREIQQHRSYSHAVRLTPMFLGERSRCKVKARYISRCENAGGIPLANEHVIRFCLVVRLTQAFLGVPIVENVHTKPVPMRI